MTFWNINDDDINQDYVVKDLDKVDYGNVLVLDDDADCSSVPSFIVVQKKYLQCNSVQIADKSILSRLQT